MILIKKLTFLVLFFSFTCVVACKSSEDRAEELYQKGVSAIEKEPLMAEKAFKNSLLMKKNNVKAIYGLALVAINQGDSELAFGYMNQVLEIDPRYTVALTGSCRILMNKGSFDLALERCNRALEINPNNIEALNVRTIIQLKLEDMSGSVDYAKQALSLDPKNQQSYLIFSTDRLIAKDNSKAIEYLNKALDIDDRILSIQLVKALVLENNSQLTAADETYQKIIKLFKNSSFARKCYVFFLLRQGYKDRAEMQLRLIEKSATPKDIWAKLDVVRFVTSQRGAKAGQIELENYANSESRNYELAFLLLDLYRVQNESEKEDALLDSLLKKAGDTPDGYKARGMLAEKFIRLGKSVDAINLINKILQKDNRNQQALILRANLAIDAKDYESAIADLRIVVTDSPKSNLTALMLAQAYEGVGLLALAEDQYKNAFKNSGHSQNYGVPYSEFLLRTKQPLRAAEIVKQTVDGGSKLEISHGIDNQNRIYHALLFINMVNDKTPSVYFNPSDIGSADIESIHSIVSTYQIVGKDKEAIEFLNNIYVKNPFNAAIGLLLGKVYDSVGETSKAIKIITNTIAHESLNSQAYQLLALLQIKSNQYENALQTVNRGLSYMSDDFELNLMKANVYAASGRIEESIHQYERLLEERPYSIMASGKLALLLLKYRTDSISMNRMYKLAKVAKNSELPEFLDTYGHICYKLGKLVEAERSFRMVAYKKSKVNFTRHHFESDPSAKK
jgi:cellulose synthase operon protein C